MQKTTELSFNVLPDIDIKITRASSEGGKDLKDPESHIHKECEIYVNLSGDVSFEVENRIYPVSRGSVIITRPYEYHHCIYHSYIRHDHYWITFSTSRNNEFAEIFFNREKGKGNLIALDENALKELSEVLEELLKGGEDKLGRQINILKIFYILKQGKSQEYRADTKNLSQDVALALKFMDKNLSEEITIEEIAKNSFVSVNSLERHFKNQLLATPFQILRKKRLYLSLQFLRQGFSVSEAGIKSGFSDYSNYIQLFKKQFSITPLQYKLNMKE